MKLCASKICSRPTTAGRKYCSKHWQQIKKHGHILKMTSRTPSRLIENGNICEIELRNIDGKTKSYAIIDREDILKVAGKIWYEGGMGYAMCNTTYPKQLHRLILGLKTGDKKCTDHINRNRLDNRKVNLRIVSTLQNNRNRNIQKNNSSGTPGVHYNKIDKKWIARIGIKRKRIVLGWFNTKEEAEKSRKKAEKKYWQMERIQ